MTDHRPVPIPLLKLHYDRDEIFEPINVGRPIAKDSDTLRGYVGFRWKRVKFQVRNLVITGKVDIEAALALLEAKGIKNSSAIDSPEEEEEAPTKSRTKKKSSDDGDFDF